MKCEEVKINLPEYIDDKLTPEVAGKIRSHLQNCDSCRELHSELKSFLKFTDSFPEITPPEGMKEEFMDMLGVAIYMGGGPSLMTAAEALIAFEEFSSQ